MVIRAHEKRNAEISPNFSLVILQSIHPKNMSPPNCAKRKEKSEGDKRALESQSGNNRNGGCGLPLPPKEAIRKRNPRNAMRKIEIFKKTERFFNAVKITIPKMSMSILIPQRRAHSGTESSTEMRADIRYTSESA
jgi:hypothetical protein